MKADVEMNDKSRCTGRIRQQKSHRASGHFLSQKDPRWASSAVNTAIRPHLGGRVGHGW